MRIDPVCGMSVDPETCSHDHTFEQETYYFCSSGCMTKFAGAPEDFLNGVKHPPVEAAPGAKWICPMDPEILEDEPGSCPICGMALEPTVITAEEGGPNHELIDMTRRFWVGLAFGLPLLVLEMGLHLAGFDWTLWVGGPVVGNWIQLALATPVVVWCGRPFFERGWISFTTLQLNMFSLIALGTGAGYAFSVVATVVPNQFPSAFRGHGGAVDVYFEASAVIIVLVLLGQILELRARARTGSALRALLDLAPKTARRVGHDGDEDIALPPSRPAPGAARRERTGRRHHRRRRQRDRRSHGHRRTDAGREGSRQCGHWRDR